MSPQTSYMGNASFKPLPLLPQRQRATSEPPNKRNASISGRLRNMLPSQRPERGGTIREHGFWEQLDSNEAGDAQVPRHQRTGSRQSRQSETADSDRIVRWNTAKEIPKKRMVQRPTHARATSLGIETLMALSPNRKWNWAPREANTLANSLSRAAATEVGGQGPVNGVLRNQASEREAAKVANRRLSHARRIIEAKREQRRVRRSLKESGDYLGVQGINPETGQLDIVTPSDSEHSALGLETEQKIDSLRQIIKTAPPSNSATTAKAEREIKKIILKEQDKILRLEEEKQALQRAQNRIKWRRHTKQWSSAQEPNLSPIPQSHKDMSPVSRRQSAVGKQPSREGILIDLSSPNVSPLDQRVSSQNEQESIGISGSSGTIVRTPHKSTVDLSLAAQELFENGISFDSRDQSKSSRETTTHHLDFGKAIESLSFAGQNQEEAQSACDVQTKGRSATEADSPKISPASQNYAQPCPDGSFLDIRAEEKVDPGGMQGRLGIDNMMHLRQTTFPPTSLVSRKGRHKALRDKNEGMLRGFAQDLMTSLKRSSTTAKMSPESKLQPPFEGSQLEDCDLTFLLESQVKNQIPNLQEVINNSHTPMEIRWDGDAETVFGEKASLPTPLQPKDLKQHPRDVRLTKNKIQGDLEALRIQMAQVNQSRTRPQLNPSEPNQPEPTWAQDAIRDITNKYKEVMGESASTIITTTIGSGLVRSPSSQNQGDELLVGHPRSWKSGQPTCTASNTLEPCQSSQTKLIQNTLPSATPHVEAPVTDVSSMRHLGPTRRRTQQLATTESRAEETPAPPQCNNISPTSTSTARKDEHVKDGQLQIRYSRPAEASRKTMDKSVCPSAQKVRGSDSKVEPKRQKLARLWRDQGPPPPPATVRWIRAEINRTAEDFTMRIPGSYPNHLDVEDDIANLSKSCGQQSLRSSCRAKVGGLWDATKEVSQTVRTSGAWLLKSYWTTVAPVFNFESEYWARHDQDQSTCWDCIPLVLAVPAALLVMTGFV